MAVKLDQYQTIVNVHWPLNFTHLAFIIGLQEGVPQANVSLTCGGGGEATGEVMGSYCPGYTYSYVQSTFPLGMRDGVWQPDTVGGVTITGLPVSDVVTLPVWTVQQQESQVDQSRISPVASGGTILIPPGGGTFSSEIGAVAELYTTIADGTPYCVNPNFPAAGPLDHFLGANVIGKQAGGLAPSSILSRVSVVYRGVTFLAAGTFTVERLLPILDNDNYPKELWCLFANPDP